VEYDYDLESIPFEIEKFPNLKALYLSNCNLKEFPTQILNLKKLESLNLQRNDINFSLPDNISKLSSLKILGITLAAGRAGSPAPFRYDEIAKLMSLNLDELHLYEYFDADIDMDLISSCRKRQKKY
jgi:hypothetical protein